MSRSALQPLDPVSDDDSEEDQYEDSDSSDDDHGNGNDGQDWLDSVEAFTFDQIQFEV